MHRTPQIFGHEASQMMIGFQTACGYLCSTFIPLGFGALAGWLGLGILPFALLAFLSLLILVTERLSRTVQRQNT